MNNSSSKPPTSSDEPPVTPRVNREERLLTPPPAPVGCIYDDNDALTNSGIEERQASSTREVRNLPILEFPSITNLTPDTFTFAGNHRRGDASALPPRQSRHEMRGRGHRRSNSFDAIAPLPSISLRPRFSQRGLRQSPFAEVGPRRHNSECDCLDCTRGFSLERPAHLRAHTYDNNSAVFAEAFAEEALSQSPPPLPSIPSEMDVSSLERDLPSISPPKSTFYGPSFTIDNHGISRPIPRKLIRQSKIEGDNRHSLGNTSEGNTICTVLSSSNHSAFGTPTRGKNPNSPLTSGSDSASPEVCRNNEIPDDTQPQEIPEVRGFLPGFPHCKSNERPSQMVSPRLLFSKQYFRSNDNFYV